MRLQRLLIIIILAQFVTNIVLIATIIKIRIYLADVLRTESPVNVALQPENGTANVDKVNLSTKVSATVVGWDFQAGFDSVKQNKQYLDSISPFWFELNYAGEIVPFEGAQEQNFINYLKQNKVKITPIISNEFNPEPLASIINDPEKRSNHIQELVNLAVSYDGINLNYENLESKDKDNFSNFITKLAAELHKNDKLLGVYLHAKTEEPGTWGGPQSQDWGELAKVCDKLKIMAYDYHWSTSGPGAIAPPDWVEEVVSHAIEIIPREKIYLGIPLYGYDWSEGTEEAAGLTFEEVIDLTNSNGAEQFFDEGTKSPFFNYSDNNYHEVWFENSESVKYKYEIAEKYEIEGIDFFRLGGEDNSIWSQIEEVFTDGK